MRKFIYRSCALVILCCTHLLYGKGFEVDSGRWYLLVNDDGSLTISPGSGFRPGIAAVLKSGSIDAKLFKEKLRRSLKPGPVLMNGTSPRLPLEVQIIDGDKSITGTVDDGRIWNEMMEIVLPQAYPDRGPDSDWENYIEKRQPFVPVDEPTLQPEHEKHAAPNAPGGRNGGEKTTDAGLSQNSQGTASRSSVPLDMATPKAAQSLGVEPSDGPRRTALQLLWIAGAVAVIIAALAVLFIFAKRRL